MKCLILAAGYATRLYPLTEHFPKPLLEVGGKAILDWLVDDLDACGLVDECILISNHRYAAHFARWASGRVRPVTVVDDGSTSNGNRLGAVVDVQVAIDHLGLDDELLVIAGDNVLDFSLARFIAYAQARGTSCVMRYHEADPARLRRSGVACIDAQGRLLSMEEKPAQPRSNWCIPPFYYFTREDARLVRQGIEAGCGTDAPGSFIAWLCTRVPVHAMEMPGQRFDVGDLASYRLAQENYRGITG